jgi:hypothetical protein
VAESASAGRLPSEVAAPAQHPHGPQSWMLWAIVVTAIAVVTGSIVLALASDQLDLPGLRAFLIAWIVIRTLSAALWPGGGGRRVVWAR